ncbi:hypothetical protein JDS91_23445 [Bacillus cereus]|uniref:hypothetical protein n=1 Tax=Bacillus cereus TaxID=1396 RepID=UPI0018F4D68C|nr:hypothetical protein [Bacillus cereus]
MQSISSFTIRCASFLYEHILLYFILLALNITFSVLLMDLIYSIPTAEGAIESFKLLTGYYFGNSEGFWKTIFLSSLNGIIWIVLSIVPIMLAIAGSEKYNQWLRITLFIFGFSFVITGLYFIGQALSLFGTLLIICGIIWLFVKVFSQ